MKKIDKEGVEWLVEMDVLQPNIEKTRTMKQQLAVEWLYQHLFPKQLDGFSEEEWSKIDVAFDQAKEMEKEQRGYSEEEIQMEKELVKFLKYIKEAHVDDYGHLEICDSGDELDPTVERVVKEYMKLK
jgi:hypothetical protein